MKAVLVIAAIAALIRVTTATAPALTAVVVGILAIGAAVYGLRSNGRSHWRGWTVSWGVVTVGLAVNLIGAAIAGLEPGALSMEGRVPLVVTSVGELITIAGLVLIINQRVPGHWGEALIGAAVATATAGFPLLSLVVVPSMGWDPGRELLPMAVPALGVMMLWLGASVVSLTDRHPVAYRYLIGGFMCLLAARTTATALLFMGAHSFPVPLNAAILWGTCLWSCAILHNSQRRALDPATLRSTRPGWAQVVLVIFSVLVAPVVIAVKVAFHIPFSRPVLTAGFTLLPALAVMYLLYQVFARSAAEYRAQHDPLTGVCNRVLFNDRLDAAIVDARRNGRSVAVMFLDLDRFKSVNDSLGHAVGNQLLQAVVKRLQSRLRPKDTLARMGGDEFTILFPEVEGKEAGANLAERVLAAFSEPINVSGKLLPVQTSIGVAVYPDDGEDSETLFKHADTAMYQAKAAGRNTYSIYNAAMSAKAELRFALETNLRGALEQGRLTVHYQPKLSAATGQITGVEALARWEHPRLGFIPPSAFIPLAEETSLIATLGEWVLETACLQAKSWQEQGLSGLSVAVNVSPRQFVRQSVVQVVAKVLERTGLDPTLLELEVTESVLVEHMQETSSSLAELRSMGVRCSIDDFGTGYSALTYLAEMPVDAIKIDPSFVHRIDNETGAAPIVGSVIALAHSLGLKVVAEGVETVGQLEFLSEQGCDQVQGYLFSRPVPAEEIEKLVTGPIRVRVELPAGSVLRDSTGAVLPPARVAAVLAGVSARTDSAFDLDGDDFLAVLECFGV
ncbi:MAG TPA: EAL domain-containing protein [Acidimicrobiales bacterium]